jgi:hypothetical protein
MEKGHKKVGSGSVEAEANKKQNYNGGNYHYFCPP